MDSQNFEGVSLSENVQLGLTVGDVENLFFALSNCTIPLLSIEGNKGYIATFNSIFGQVNAQLGLNVEGENIVSKDKNIKSKIDNLDISGISGEVTQAEKDAERQ